MYIDDCFDVEGPSYLLNKEFQQIIGEKKVSADYEVKDVMMVNIEQLMRIEKFFAAEKLDLAYLINSYIEYKEEFELNRDLCKTFIYKKIHLVVFRSIF